MFKKFGQGLPQSLIDAVTNVMTEAKHDEPEAPDADAIARRKRLQALRDKQEDDEAENSYTKEKSPVRKVAGRAYGGAAQKDEPEVDEELTGNQHKIDDNKNGKNDAHDFKLLRAKKKVSEDIEELDEVSTSKKQARTMAAAAHNPSFAKKVGIPTKVAKDFNKADKGTKQLSQAMKEDSELHLDLSEGKYEDLPFEPDEKPKKSAIAGKQGYGKSLSKHLSHLGLKKTMDSKKKSKQETMMGTAGATSEETVIESRGHKIISNKLKQMDMIRGLSQNTKDKLKDSDNLTNVEIVKQKDTSIKEADESNYTHDQVAKALPKGLKSEKDILDHSFEHLKKTKGLTTAKNLHGSEDYQSDVIDAYHSHHGVNEEVEELDEVNINELSKKTLGSYINKAADPSKSNSNVNLSSRAASKLADGGEDDGTSDDRKAYQRSKGIQRAAGKLAEEQHTHVVHTLHAKKDGDVAGPKIKISAKDNKDAWHQAEKLADKHGGYVDKVVPIGEEVELDETASLDRYIKSMGYDPQNMEKNKKVMFAKTNAFKTWATSRNEAMFDGGQKGTQDIEAGMSPGATARG